MKTTAHIKVSTKVGNLLNTREAADSFMDFVNTSSNSDIVELDFEQVEFMSRSFADQFHKIRTRLLAQSRFSAIDIVNASPVVIEMLQTVSRTQNKTDRHYETFPVYKFKEVNALQKFLSTL
jgi:hypothetical protein